MLQATLMIRLYYFIDSIIKMVTNKKCYRKLAFLKILMQFETTFFVINAVQLYHSDIISD